MTDQEQLNKLNSKLVVWKYVVLMFLAGVTLAVAVTQSEQELKNIAPNFAVSAIVALILSLIYDVFIKKENELSAQIKMDNMSRDLAANMLGRYGPNIIPRDQLGDFLEQGINDDVFLAELARKIDESEERSEIIASAVLRPLFTEPMLIEVNSRNYLTPDSQSNDVYNWDLEQSFRVNSPKHLFRCIVVADNDIGSRLNAVSDGSDALVFISPSSFGNFRESILNSNISMRAEEIYGGGRHITDISADIKIDNIKTIYPAWPEDWEGRIAVIDFELLKQGVGVGLTHVFSLRTKLRYKDSFFYWIADRPCHMRSIEIDFSKISQRVGRIAVLPTVSGRTVQCYLDRDRGRVGVRADCMFWSGQGIFCVWRPDPT